MLHSRTMLIAALVALLVGTNGLTYLWSYAVGLDAGSSTEAFPEAYLVVHRDGKRVGSERIGAEVTLEQTMHGIQVRGYRLEQHREWSEPFLFLIPNGSTGRLCVISESMVGLYGVEPSPDVEGPAPLPKPPVEYDPTPRFTVDPPLATGRK